MALAILNGNIKTAPTNLNKRSIERPIILNGSRINQTRGNKMIIMIAKGQQMIRRMHQRRNPIKDIDYQVILFRWAKFQPNLQCLEYQTLEM